MTLQEAFFQAPTTNTVAVGAAVSPFWLPYLQTTSDIATLVLPVAGLAWLVVQIFFFFKDRK